MTRSISVLATDTPEALDAVRLIGCNTANIRTAWGSLQSDGPGTPLAEAELNRLATLIRHAQLLKMSVRLSVDWQYPPPVVFGRLPWWRAYDGSPITFTVSDIPSGKVAFDPLRPETQLARADVITKLAAGLKAHGVSLGSIGSHRIGGGPFGELSAPAPGSHPDTAPGELIADAKWQIKQWRAAGFGGTFYLLLPGSGARPEQDATDQNKINSLRRGEDHAAVITAFASDLSVVPYPTLLNTTPPSWGVPVWREVALLNAVNGGKVGMVGENTGGEDFAAMQTIFADAVTKSGYGLAVLGYDSLTAPGSAFTLAQLGQLIQQFKTAHPGAV